MLEVTTTLTAAVIEIAHEAGSLLSENLSSLHNQIKTKPDNTPVTLLDKRLNTFIVQRLRYLTPSVAILAEEDQQHAEVACDEFWCVDPIDGTKGL